MPKIVLFILIIFCLVTSACTPTATRLPVTSAAVSPAWPTSTLSPTPAVTQQSTRTPTPVMSTPLPTIPTFTPTFDARTIVTATPAPAAKCPKEKKSLKATFKLPISGDPATAPGIDNEILDFLNKGGAVQNVLKHINSLEYPFNNRALASDVTGDGIQDVLFVDFGAIMGLHIYTCSNGVYMHHSPYTIRDGSYYLTKVIAVKDMNLDNVSEVVIEKRGCSGTGCYSYQVLSWNGKDFLDLSPGAKIEGADSTKVEDIDHNNLIELHLTGGIPGQGSFAAGYPWRQEIRTYKWNGTNFVLQPIEYSNPQFRFQAIQDADRAVKAGWYEKAFALYETTISSQELDWWSLKRSRDTFYDPLDKQSNPDKALPAPGQPDPTEYPRLAAYAYYRMIILHTYLNEVNAAQIKYATLQEKFPADNPGHPYVEMAMAFWEIYQTSQDITAACGAAIQYADQHPEILIPLGSDYHGDQSHSYKPADICPFR